jgi:hypothetical protein
MGQKQTSDCRLLMSALPPKADIVGRNGDVRFVPKAEVARLLDDPIRSCKHGRRNGDSQRLGAVQIDYIPWAAQSAALRAYYL